MHSQRKFNCVCPVLFTVTMHSEQKFYTTANQSFTATVHSRRMSYIYGRSILDREGAFSGISSSTILQSSTVTMHFQRKFDYRWSILHRDDKIPSVSWTIRVSISHHHDVFPAEIPLRLVIVYCDDAFAAEVVNCWP